MEYYSLNNYLNDVFGGKVYKIAIDAGFSCPNRDGRAGYGGCIFCSGSGSGDFAGDRRTDVRTQIEEGKARIEAKMTGREPKYIAYFQAFTGTYAPVNVLKAKYMEAINHPEVVGISIATRPDCLPDEVIELIAEINRIKPVWIELGLQTVHEDTAGLINRGYELAVYEAAIEKLVKTDVHIVTHVILGLPGENRSKMLETVRFVGDIANRYKDNLDGENNNEYRIESALTETVTYNLLKNEACENIISKHRFGIKLQLLHVIKGTRLADMYEAGEFRTLDMDEYVELIADCLEVLPKDMVIHRITGDGDKRTLIAPLWSGDKKRVLNALNKEIRTGNRT